MQYIFIIALLGSLGGLGFKMYTDTMNRMQSMANEKAALEVKFQGQRAAMERQLEVMKLQEESLGTKVDMWVTGQFRAPCYNRLRKEFKVGVIGLGYVGLPRSIQFCKKKIQVYGIDTDQNKTKILKTDLPLIVMPGKFFKK